ncbi:hypothetical protein FRC04_011455 [Tulasnella sp. 424]|nr:hypothetical protein FRC04_011455 [Tulasnella sp. 424]
MSRSALGPESSDVLPSYFDRSSIISQSSPPSYSGHQMGRPRIPAYTYLSKRFTVTLDVQRGAAPNPTYGREGKVEGSVQVVSWDHAESLVVTLEGTLRVITMKQSIPNVTRTTKSVFRTVNLPVSSGDSGSDTGPRHFALGLPIWDDSETAPIPPTFYAASADLQVEVRYSLNVALTRRGLHKDDSLVIPVRYFPQLNSGSIPEEIGPQSLSLIRFLEPSLQAGPSNFIVTVESDASDKPAVSATVNKQVVVVQHGQKFQASRELLRAAITAFRFARGRWEASGCLRLSSDAVGQSPEWSFGGVMVVHVLRIQARYTVKGQQETYVHSQPLPEPVPQLYAERDPAAPASGD